MDLIKKELNIDNSDVHAVEVEVDDIKSELVSFKLWIIVRANTFLQGVYWILGGAFKNIGFHEALRSLLKEILRLPL